MIPIVFISWNKGNPMIVLRQIITIGNIYQLIEVIY